MKKEIHPKYFEKAKVTCACGNKFTVGSTKEEINVEICSACHPFYTGQEKILDSAGRVEKFKAKRAAATGKVKSKTRPNDRSPSVGRESKVHKVKTESQK